MAIHGGLLRDILNCRPWRNSIFATQNNPCGYQEDRLWQIREPYCVPPQLFQLLTPKEIKICTGKRIACYPTLEEAEKDFFKALTKWKDSN